jgi:5-oxoprolinase (ATP-hydrolysing) subunit A
VPGALISNPGEAARQATCIVRDGTVIATDGTSVSMAADTLCIHSDTPNSIDIATRVRRELKLAGITVA